VKEEVRDIVIATTVNAITVGAGILLGYTMYPIIVEFMK
jgi:hypothetical protein